MKRKWSFIQAVILLILAPMVLGQDWLVPEDQSALINPSEYNLDNVKRGKDLYLVNCKSCHGDPGKNNPLALLPLPIDIASEKMHLNTQGALFYKITNGKGVMPPFASSISVDDRWKLVNFITNFKPGGEVVMVEAPPVKAKLMASVNEDLGIVEILAEYEGKNSSFNSLANAEVTVSSKKAFGNIKIGEAITNENGRAEFSIPESVIGDEEGYVSLTVSLDDNFVAQDVALEKAKVGRMKEVPTLINGDVLWSTNENVSLWLLFSYLLLVFGAWGVIVYVIIQVIKVKRYSKL